jgi:MFS transporter, ACS family, D-galactonate transporter
MEDRKRGWKYYHTVWLLFFLAWTVSYVDRALMTPVITWMIANKVSFFANVHNVYTLGGLIGGLFFAGYMLVQLPAGFLGDRYGNKAMVVVCIVWAGLATLVTGFAGSLFAFVAFRVFTGLGEGALYSNDRSLIAAATPPHKLGTGMGIAITGVSLGTVISLFTGAATTQWAAKIWGNEIAWRVPFWLWVVPTLIVAILLKVFIKDSPPVKYAEIREIKPNYPKAVVGLSRYAAVFLILVMLVYYLSISMGLSNLVIAFIETGLAVAVIVYMFVRQGEHLKEIFLNKNLWHLNIAAIAILWSMWFYGFWAPSLIKEVAHSSFMVAILTALFTAGAGLIGYPIGGWVSDIFVKKGWGKKSALLGFTTLHCLTVFLFWAYLVSGGKSPFLMAPLLFLSGFGLYGMQPICHSMIFDFAPPDKRSTAYGAWNLIGEIGAVLSPVVAGALRDATGAWTQPVLLDGVIVLIAVVSVLTIKGSSAQANVAKSRAVS